MVEAHRWKMLQSSFIALFLEVMLGAVADACGRCGLTPKGDSSAFYIAQTTLALTPMPLNTCESRSCQARRGRR